MARLEGTVHGSYATSGDAINVMADSSGRLLLSDATSITAVVGTVVVSSIDSVEVSNWPLTFGASGLPTTFAVSGANTLSAEIKSQPISSFITNALTAQISNALTASITNALTAQVSNWPLTFGVSGLPATFAVSGANTLTASITNALTAQISNALTAQISNALTAQISNALTAQISNALTAQISSLSSPITSYSGLDVPIHDYIGLSYDASDNLTGVDYQKSSVTVATLALGYTASNALTSVVRT
jgi:hypothetical protein